MGKTLLIQILNGKLIEKFLCYSVVGGIELEVGQQSSSSSANSDSDGDACGDSSDDTEATEVVAAEAAAAAIAAASTDVVSRGGRSLSGPGSMTAMTTNNGDENDVDDETMSGDNDIVEHNQNIGGHPSLQLSDFDSLTLTERSLDSSSTLPCALPPPSSVLDPSARSSSSQHQRTTSATSSSLAGIEDEVLLMRLIDLQQRQPAHNSTAPGASSRR